LDGEDDELGEDEVAAIAEDICSTQTYRLYSLLNSEIFSRFDFNFGTVQWSQIPHSKDFVWTRETRFLIHFHFRTACLIHIIERHV